MERKKIAIFGWKSGDNSFGITVPYYDYFDNFGDVSILSPVAEIDFDKYDLLVVPGGPDVSPNSYGNIPSMFTGKSDPIREYFDKYMIPEAIEAKIPIVGICRGHQSIATHFGGTLRQHMYHNTNLASQRDKTVHGLDIFPEVLPEELSQALKNSKIKTRKVKNSPGILNQEVNSMHHQTVLNVPEGALLLGTHYHDKDFIGDKSIEALYYPDHAIITFQYHPEEIWDRLSRICITYLLKKAGKNDRNEKSSTAKESIRV